MAGIITLTTDFGTSDAYVAAMKGVILGINPEVTLVDITHEIAPQAVPSGAFVLSAAYSFFPPGTIHIAVVDPGVGTERRSLILCTSDAFFIAPDNGILSYVLADHAPVPGQFRPRAQPFAVSDVSLSAGLAAY
ncbi:MAG: SAM-dependent chlorinase/fluorinase, partial [Chloroflexi bacterium]|nr:SAM-dependent chlorinase/fluorinase [Chloroflexota bacterium]